MSFGASDEGEEEIVSFRLDHRHLAVSQGRLGSEGGGRGEGLQDGPIVAESALELHVDVGSVIAHRKPRIAGCEAGVGAVVPLEKRRGLGEGRRVMR